MSQAQPAPKSSTSPLGVQAAAAATATSTPAAKPTDVKADTKPDAAPDDKKARMSRKVFVVLGEIHEFDSALKAEKFLNAEGAPSNYSVLKGNRIGTSKKVSLR